MGKEKPRLNPDKKQNNYLYPCPYFEDHNGFYVCEGGETNAAKICKGNPHNCVKTKYHKLASNK